MLLIERFIQFKFCVSDFNLNRTLFIAFKHVCIWVNKVIVLKTHIRALTIGNNGWLWVFDDVRQTLWSVFGLNHIWINHFWIAKFRLVNILGSQLQIFNVFLIIIIVHFELSVYLQEFVSVEFIQRLAELCILGFVCCQTIAQRLCIDIEDNLLFYHLLFLQHTAKFLKLTL